MKHVGNFILKGGTITTVEASIYESRRGIAETNTFDLEFDNGLSLKVKAIFTTNLSQIEVKEEDEEGRVVLAIDGYGRFQFIGEDKEIVFEGQWETVEGTRVVIYNNLISELILPCEFSGFGANSHTKQTISGIMTPKLTGFDESGTGIYEIFGEGVISDK